MTIITLTLFLLIIPQQTRINTNIINSANNLVKIIKKEIINLLHNSKNIFLTSIEKTYYEEYNKVTKITPSFKNKKEILEIIVMYGKLENNLDYELIFGLIDLESNFNHLAVGKNKKSYDFGLFQHNSVFWNIRKNSCLKIVEKHPFLFKYQNKFNNKKSYYDPIVNVIVGIWLLNENRKHLYLRNNFQMAIAHNCPACAIDFKKRRVLRKQTRNYLNAFLIRYNKYQERIFRYDTKRIKKFNTR